jgi:hypothetical protein
MNKSMTIDYNEYMGLLEGQDQMRREVERLKRYNYDLQQKFQLMKNNAEDVLVIHKDGDIEKAEFKSTEKTMLANIATVNNQIYEKYYLELDTRRKLELELQDYQHYIQDLVTNNQSLERQLTTLRQRNWWQRLWNKK